jgi:hypothetical protein
VGSSPTAGSTALLLFSGIGGQGKAVGTATPPTALLFWCGFCLSQMPERRFSAPWTAELTPNCFIVRDANGQH